MPEGNTNTPSFVLYINNSRIAPEREAEIKRIIIHDRVNDISSFTLHVSDPDYQWRDNDDFYIGSKVKIMLGYKDAITELMIGEITGISASYKRNQAPEVTVTGKNLVHRLKRTIHIRAFNEMTVKDIISQIADESGLNADVEDLSYEHPFALYQNMSDYDYLLEIADQYDCFFTVFDTSLTFKRLENNKSEDVVLEYNKSLLAFSPITDISRMISEVQVLAWDPAQHEGIEGSSTAGDIDSQGGKAVEDAFGSAPSIYIDPYAIDQNQADQQAVDILVRNNRGYITGTGTTFGNTDIKAGAIIKVEGVGGKFSDKYLVLSATHTLVPAHGYHTSFTFTAALGTPSQQGVAATAGQQQAAAATTAQEEQEEEGDETTPEITNLKWVLEGEEVTEALVGDMVVLTADAKNIDGSQISISIWEKDDVGSDDFIKKVSASVSNGKIEKEWTVEYHEDTDDTESSGEQEEKGYTLPEYVFKMETTTGPEVVSEESPVLEVKDWIEIEVIDPLTNEPVTKASFTLTTADGNTMDVQTDDKGMIQLTIPPGKCSLTEKEEET